MSARERNRYVTVATAFLIAFGILGLLLLRSVWVTAQIIDFTWRPQAATTNTYDGKDLDNCETGVTISSTQRLGFAFDQNLVTAATTYTDADIFNDGLDTPDTGFTESGKWSSFQQTTVFIMDTDLLVRIAGKNNSTTARQWKIEYSVDGPITGPWNEMVRFKISYDNDTDEGNLAGEDKIINTTRDHSGIAEVGFITDLNTTDNEITLERYYPGEFLQTDFSPLWKDGDSIQTVDGSSFLDQMIGDAVMENNPGNPDADPPDVIVLGQVLGNNTDLPFLTDDSSDPNYILNVLASELAVRIQTSQQGCSTDGVDTCPLCGGDPADLAILNIYDIQVETTWNTDLGGDAPLGISTESLPDANKYSSYDELIEAYGGNIGTGGYVWEIISGNLPPEFNDTNLGPTDYDLQIYYSGGPPHTTPGTYNFTVKVTDESDPPQTAQKPFSIHVAGLAIDPPGPDLPPAIKGTAYSQDFEQRGGGPDYKWCIVSGTIPPGLSFSPTCPYCPSTTTGNNTQITLSGTPTNAGSYGFTLRLTDSSGDEEPAEQYYQLDVSTTGVEIIKKLLKPMVKGVLYSNTGSNPYQPMEAQSLTAVRVTNSTDVSDVTWSATGLPSGLLSLDTSKTLDTVDSISRAYIVGTIDIDADAGDYRFTANVDDNGADSDNESDLMLKVLERKTLLLKAPPSSVELPSDHKLKFVVFAEGGAPSTQGSATPVGTQVPYYNYDWSVTPVNSASPALNTASGTTSTNKAEPETITITFEDSSSIPVSGVYDVRFWARDVLRRKNGTDPDYKFVPATVRLKVNAPPELEKRPIKLRQEQF